MEEQNRKPLRTFGRRGGRPLSARQHSLVEKLLSELRVPVVPGDTLDAAELVPGAKSLWLEIGFGGGEHPVGQARANPEVGILASEVFLEGVAKCLSQIEAQGVQNIRLWDQDARDFMAALPEGSIQRAFVLFPDPWPKTRHHKRRLVQKPFLDELARLVPAGGQLRFATDVCSYADEALQKIINHGTFIWLAERADDWQTAPVDHVKTRYETKNIGDIRPVYFDFLRI